MRRRTPRRCTAALEVMEERVCLASSVGWDGPGRGAAVLTYYIGNAPSSLSQTAVTAAIRAALNAWSKVAAVTFVQTSQPNRPDSIDFTFRSLDGRGGTLAQAYFPDDVNRSRIAGDVQFDSAERWEVGNNLGGAAFDLVLIAVHEIGHSLGLDHSRVASSVMGATISPNQRFNGLGASDVTSVLSLYARAGTSTSSNTTTARPTGVTRTPAFRATAPELIVAAPAAPGSLPTFSWASWAWGQRTARASRHDALTGAAT
jgi:hypothetical protein